MKVIATAGKGPFIHNTRTSAYTINREYFDVKIFLDSLACVKLNARNTCAILTTMRYRIVCQKII